jgi:DNA-binding XRE family transcriptional regulator
MAVVSCPSLKQEVAAAPRTYWDACQRCPACGCIQRSAKENERGPPSRSEKIARQNPRRLRNVRGLSWSELAAEAKITRSQLNRLEKGAYNAGFDTVSKLATP